MTQEGAADLHTHIFVSEVLHLLCQSIYTLLLCNASKIHVHETQCSQARETEEQRQGLRISAAATFPSRSSTSDVAINFGC